MITGGRDHVLGNLKKNRHRIILVSTALLAFWTSAEAQQHTRLAKIGWLARAGAAPRLELFQRELHRLGYVEVKTSQSNPDRLDHSGARQQLMNWYGSKWIYLLPARQTMP